MGYMDQRIRKSIARLRDCENRQTEQDKNVPGQGRADGAAATPPPTKCKKNLKIISMVYDSLSKRLQWNLKYLKIDYKY